jgi:hypothetical protein
MQLKSKWKTKHHKKDFKKYGYKKSGHLLKGALKID